MPQLPQQLLRYSIAQQHWTKNDRIEFPSGLDRRNEIAHPFQPEAPFVSPPPEFRQSANAF